MKRIVADLRAEQDALAAIVAGIEDKAWSTPTPAEGWDVRDQIGHLAFFDGRATEAILDPEGFMAGVAAIAKDVEEYMESHLDSARASTPDNLRSQWDEARATMYAALAPLEPSTHLPWYGPPMSAHSFAVARLMETWAHGQDVVDALEIRRKPTKRLQHIALLGVKTMSWSFTVNGLPQPATKVRVELTGPGGDAWVWNDSVEESFVRGDAEDFCLVVTQRRHLDDTSLEVFGDAAERWMPIAQAFAGPPGSGRQPGMFP
ncbi:MAG: TIGR03084 family metal-binding protein [Actinomycetota bacterium]